ncbi:hypothetical protein Rhopal_006000-T1 [Rhodotorula paludigena]|uniref:DNA polymerase delta subunit 4 n=1 Tax=Rhodotorula paludigena TaxID=86838 RepID=A0AAV5GJY9_9BASI|nr:hypothetical protein Rhopal_006000-T1 [Rhodotorula paludigena]
MPPKSRSTSSKSASSTKASPSLGFGSTKKSLSATGGTGKKAASGLARQDSGGSSGAARDVTPARAPKSSLSGLYPKLFKEAKRKMGPAIHPEEMDDIEIILRVFDAEEEYGPCSRISRLERFERAEKLGLNPDPEIGEILRSEDGKSRKNYRDSVFQI